MTTLLTELGTSFTIAVLAGLATIIVAVINRRGRVENQLIDQLQEERIQLREERAELLDRLIAIEHRERLRDDYIRELRSHIDRRRPPPPPPWPEGTS